MRRRRVVRFAGAIVVLGVIYVAMNAFFVWRSAHTDQAASEGIEAIVVLGAAQYDGRPSPVLQARLDHALDLYNAGRAPLIVTTGSNQPGDRFTQGFAGYDYLRNNGVPDEAIVVIVDGEDTYGELSATAVQLRRLGHDHVLLVSDPFHAERAAAISREVGLRPVVSPTDTEESKKRFARETVAVSLGRIVGYRRLSSWL